MSIDFGITEFLKQQAIIAHARAVAAAATALNNEREYF